MKEFFALPKQIQMREWMSFVARILESAITPFMAMYYVQYFGAFWAGLLMITTKLIGFLAGLYGGHLADLWGRKKVIDWGNFGLASGYFLVLLANMPNHIFPFLTFVGMLLAETAGTFSWPAIDAMIIDLTDEQNRRFVYPISYWFVNVSVMLGAGLAGFFYDHHFFELLLVLTVISFLNFFLAWKYFSESKPANLVFEHGSSPLATVKNYVSVFQDKIFLLYTLGTVFNGVIWLQIDNYIPVHLKESFIASSVFGIHISGAKMLSIMVFINTLIIVCFITTANRLTKEMKIIPQFLLGSIIFDLGMLFTIVFRSFWALFLLAILYTMGELICMPPSQVLRAEMMNENKLGTYSGFLNMAQPLASILAGAMISISAATGAVGVWLVFIVCAVLGLLLIIRAAHLHGIANQL